MTDLVQRLRDRAYSGKATDTLVEEAAKEIESLRTALSRIASQDATFSVIGGNYIVDVEPLLTDAEREAVKLAAEWFAAVPIGDTLRGLLERTK